MMKFLAIGLMALTAATAPVTPAAHRHVANNDTAAHAHCDANGSVDYDDNKQAPPPHCNGKRIADARMTAGEMLDTAMAVCPFNISNEAQREAAKAAGMSKRDSDIMIALCAMYHFGRAKMAEDTANSMLQPR